jgi:hypothetical protein
MITALGHTVEWNPFPLIPRVSSGRFQYP